MDVWIGQAVHRLDSVWILCIPENSKIPEMVELLKEAARPTRIILFGSQARETARPDSDLDVRVVLEEAVDEPGAIVRLSRVLSPLRIPVDLLVTTEAKFQQWNTVPGNTYANIRAEGKVLYERPARTSACVPASSRKR